MQRYIKYIALKNRYKMNINKKLDGSSVSDLEDLTQDFAARLAAYDGEEFTKRLQEDTGL